MTATAFVPAFVHPPVHSPWFDLAAQKPWEPGVYEVEGTGFLSGVYFSYWDGQRFNWVSSGPKGAFDARNEPGGGLRITRWRGIVPPSRLPLYVSETWDQSIVRVPALAEFRNKPVTSHIAEVCYLLDCLPGYELLQVLHLPPQGAVNIFRRRDPA